MAKIEKDLGIGSAYGYAKSKGYTGTEEEYAELMASYATVAEDAAASARAAAGSADEAEAARDKAAQWATGSTSGTPGATNNAEYFAGQASGSATTASSKAGEANGSANAASGSANTAAAEALKSEGFARGKQNGTDVSSDSPYYHDNAAYHAGQAAGSATTAGQQATAASGSADVAAASALKSEGFAVGEQNGTAVGSGSPYYQNNAEYMKEQAAASAAHCDEVAASIPEDYTELSEDVSSLKQALNNTNSILYPVQFTNTVKVGESYDSSGNVSYNKPKRARTYINTRGNHFAIRMNGNTYQFNIMVCNANDGFEKFLYDWESGTLAIPRDYPKYALIIKRTDDADIQSSESDTIKSALNLLDYTDESLSIPYMPADAKKTGDLVSDAREQTYKNKYVVDGLQYNVWDEMVELGILNDSTGAETDSTTRIRAKNYTAVIPSTYYYFQTNGKNIFVFLYDENKEHVTWASGDNYRTLNNAEGYIPSTARFMRFYFASTFGTTYTNDVCISVSSGRNGEYEAHKITTRLYPDVEDLKKSLIYINYPMMWTYGWVKADGTLKPSPSRLNIRTKYKIHVKAGLIISCTNGVKFGCALFNSSTGAYISKRGIATESYTIPYDCDIIIDAEYSPATEITDIGDLCSKINFIPTTKQMFDFINDEVIGLEKKLENEGMEGGDLDKRLSSSYINIPCGLYYKGLGDQYNMGFDADTTTAEVISAFDSLVSSYGSDYITKTDLGVCSDEIHHIYSYTFNPKFATYAGNTTPKTYPKILIITAQHGFEKSSVFGMYYFLRDVLTKWEQSPILDYIRHRCVIEYIPVANPYGFDNNIYYNVNGVNINRNYDTAGFPADPTAEPWTSNYGSVEPFDQEETQIVRDWVLDNLDAVIGIDFHTNGGGAVDEWKKVNWISFCGTENKYYQKLWEAAFSHFANTTAHFSEDYNLSVGTAVLGYATGISLNQSIFPSADVWFTDQGIPGLTFEGFNGFYGGTAFTEDEQKANSELIGNWIISALNALK